MKLYEKIIDGKKHCKPVNKIVIVKDVVNATCDDDGITTMSIYDFLLNENSLNL